MVGFQVHKNKSETSCPSSSVTVSVRNDGDEQSVSVRSDAKSAVFKMPSVGHSHSHNTNNNSLEVENKDFVLIKFVSKIVLGIITRFWALSGAAVLAILLLYWLYGGWMAFSLLVFATSGILYHAGDSLLYHPDQPTNSRLYVPSPKIFGLPYENLYIRTKDDVKLNVCLIKQRIDSTKAPTLLFLHGNAGNIGHRLLNAKGLHNLGINILMVEYRGYGLSDGTPSEDGLYLDAEAAMDFLLSRPDINHQMIMIFGRSLGGAVAINLSSHNDYHKWIAAVILENTFTYIPEIARVLFNVWVIRWLPNCFFKNQFNSRSKIKNINAPVLFISGLADGLIPPWMMLELYQLSNSPLKRLARFESGTHNDTWQCENYFDTINHFLNEVKYTFRPEKHEASKMEGGVVSIQIPPAVI